MTNLISTRTESRHGATSLWLNGKFIDVYPSDREAIRAGLALLEARPAKGPPRWLALAAILGTFLVLWLAVGGPGL